MNEVTVFSDFLIEIVRNHEKESNQPDAHIKESGAVFYRAYLQTVLVNDFYWLSDIELLCLCACRRLKHVVRAASFCLSRQLDLR